MLIYISHMCLTIRSFKFIELVGKVKHKTLMLVAI